MKTLSRAGLITAFLYLNQIFAAVPPAPLAEVVKTTLELWKAKKLPELDRYLAAYIKGNPKAVAALVCGTFLDLEYKGDMDAAAAKLQIIQAAIAAKSISASDEFKYEIEMQVFQMTSLKDELLTALGGTKADMKREADPAKSRRFYGSELPPLLKMLKLAPDAQMP